MVRRMAPLLKDMSVVNERLQLLFLLTHPERLEILLLPIKCSFTGSVYCFFGLIESAESWSQKRWTVWSSTQKILLRA